MKKYLLGIYIIIQFIMLVAIIVLIAIKEHESFQNIALLTLTMDMIFKGTISDEFIKAYKKAEEKDSFKRTGQERR